MKPRARRSRDSIPSGITMKPTPVMSQYLRLKQEAGSAILFFRMGDFYEMFGDDAVEVSRVLGLTLTSRSKGDDALRLLAPIELQRAVAAREHARRKRYGVAVTSIVCSGLVTAARPKGTSIDSLCSHLSIRLL